MALTFVLFLSLAFGQLLRGEMFSFSVLAFDIISFVFFLRHFSVFFKKPSTHFWVFLSFFGVSVFSLLYNSFDFFLEPKEILFGALYLLRFFMYASFYFIAQSFSPEQKQKTLQFLFGSLFLLFLFGVLQMIFFPSFHDLQMTKYGWDPHIGRMLSTWFDPNYLGGAFAFGATLLLPFLFQKKKWALFLFVCLCCGMFFSYSRSVYLAFFVMMFVYAFLKDIRIFLFSISVGVLVLSFSLRTQERFFDAVQSGQALFMQTEKTLDATARLRIESFRTGVQLFQKNPLIGVGMNTLPALAKREWSFMTKSHASSGIDASFLSVLAQTGIIGTLLYSFFLGSMFFKAFQNRKNNFSSAVFSGGVGILFHALFVNTLFFNLFLPIFFIAFGIIRGEKQEN